MNTTINQRVQEIADKLCNGNVSEMARIVGVNQGALRDITGTKKTKPGFETLNKIADNSTLNINAYWLLTGKGRMQSSRTDIIQKQVYKEVKTGIIPIYDIDLATNLKTLFAEPVNYEVGEIKIPNAPDCDGAIYVRGDSMSPLIESGSMIAYKQLHSLDSLISGAMYVMDFVSGGNDFLAIRYVKWEDDNNKTLRLVSYNKHYKDMIIQASDVRAIALVKIVIRMNSMY